MQLLQQLEVLTWRHVVLVALVLVFVYQSGAGLANFVQGFRQGDLNIMCQLVAALEKTKSQPRAAY